ncbi:MAG: Mur ligase family protein [Treponema sp.]|nr:Mur ligase family protein [Treponema sp.]
MEHFTTSDGVFEWLSRFTNMEKGQKPKSFNLRRMKTLIELAGHPEKCAPSIHVAGSKGKGSVTGMLAAILTSAGYRAARYMSPHVVDIRERLCIGNSYFDEEIYVSAGDELRHITEELLPYTVKSWSSIASLFDSSEPTGSEPTFWELITLLFFLCARLAKCDVMVVETGMGGRLDSTNVLDPLLSVITLIELEHTNILGNSITAIAKQKAGIVKRNKPLILAKQSAEALEVFKKRAKRKNSPLIYLPDISEIANVIITKKGTTFSLSIKNSSFNNLSVSNLTAQERSGTLREEISIPIPGKVQTENAALAVTAIKTAFPQINENVIRNGLANLNIPGRFEKISEEPPIIIDGAHTPESLSLCIETFCSLYGEGGILLFGCAADKDAAAMAKIAHSHFAKIIITVPGTFKKSKPENVYKAFAKIAEQDKTHLVKKTEEAIKQAIVFARSYFEKNSHKSVKTHETQKDEENYLPILGAGSFYLVSEIRKVIKK